MRVAAVSPEAALTLGASPGQLRFIAFTIAAIGTGIAGVLYAVSIAFVSPYAFRVDLSIFFFFSVIVGGSGRLIGPVVGTAILYLVPNALLADLASYRLLAYGAVALVIMLVFPDGVVGTMERAARRYRARTRSVRDRLQGGAARERCRAAGHRAAHRHYGARRAQGLWQDGRAQQRRRHRHAGPDPRHRRPQRLGQDHAAECHFGPRASRSGRDHDRDDRSDKTADLSPRPGSVSAARSRRRACSRTCRSGTTCGSARTPAAGDRPSWLLEVLRAAPRALERRNAGYAAARAAAAARGAARPRDGLQDPAARRAGSGPVERGAPRSCGPAAHGA